MAAASRLCRWQGFPRRLWQEETDEEANTEDQQSSHTGRVSDLLERIRPHRKQRSDYIRCQERRRGADHSAADVRGKRSPRAAQVNRKDLGEIFAEIRELRDDTQAGKEN